MILALDRYPAPPAVIVILVTSPCELIFVVAAAPAPALLEIFTAGATEYPAPPLATAIAAIAPAGPAQEAAVRSIEPRRS